MDFKSGSTRYSERDLEDEIQLKIYRLAVDEDSRLKKLKVPDIKMKYLSLGSEKNAEFFLPDKSYDRENLIESLKEIISGIKPGENIVVEGQATLRDSTLVKVVEPIR